jgi:hypothetical protein
MKCVENTCVMNIAPHPGRMKTSISAIGDKAAAHRILEKCIRAGLGLIRCGAWVIASVFRATLREEMCRNGKARILQCCSPVFVMFLAQGRVAAS